MNFISPKELFQRISWSKNSVPDPEMIQVNGGTFLMGSNENDETPIHEVELDSFLLGRFPVTQEFWVAVEGNNPSAFKSYKDLPVESVSFENVMDFIQKLNKISGKNYRLPTEAEWEYAARGGARSSGYPHSGSHIAEEVAWLDANSNRKTHPVGLLRPNELGFYDLCGNVWEWCSDWYDDEYRSDLKFRKNPKGPDFGTFRVLRGGSWSSTAAKCSVTSRFSYSGDFRNNCLGFRLAMDI
jgi:formylglycine-generating enzyme required for sulfatase activity